MTYNDDDIEPDSKEFDIKGQKSALQTLELVLKLSNQNSAEQVIAALKFSYFPFSSFCMNTGDEEGQKLQNKYLGWYNEAIAYIKKKAGLTEGVPAPVPKTDPIPVPPTAESETPPPDS